MQRLMVTIFHSSLSVVYCEFQFANATKRIFFNKIGLSRIERGEKQYSPISFFEWLSCQIQTIL